MFAGVSPLAQKRMSDPFFLVYFGCAVHLRDVDRKVEFTVKKYVMESIGGRDAAIREIRRMHEADTRIIGILGS